MSSTHCFNVNCIGYCTRLEKEIQTLKTENTILQAKNMILTHNCEEYTSHNERQQMAHQLELHLARAPITNLQIKIATLQQVNHKLNNNCNALKQTIAEYKQKQIELMDRHSANKHFRQQLKESEQLSKTFQIENWLLNEQMHTLMHDITLKDQQIARLDAKLKQAHHRFERKIRRKIVLNDHCSMCTMKISESINTQSLSALSQSSTLYYSTESAKAVIYALRTNSGSNKSCAQTALRSLSGFNKSAKTETKKRNIKHRKTSISLSSTGYDTSDKEEEDNNGYSDEEPRTESNIVIGRFLLEEAEYSVEFEDCAADTVSVVSFE